MDNVLKRDNKIAWQQIGWLGATGTFYRLDQQPGPEQEPASYTPVYTQVGTWYFNEEVKEWRVDWED